MSYVVVKEDDTEGRDLLELPLEEEEGTLRLSTLAHTFPGAIGLKYKNPATGAYRVLKVVGGEHIQPPDDGWGNTVYIAICQKASENTKRKINDRSSEGATKQKRFDHKKCCDLIVLGLPYKVTEDELRHHFETFGELTAVQLKRDTKTGQSKGFGFIQFAEYDAQVLVLSQRHNIQGRWCDVKIPDSSKELESAQLSRKVFVGRVTPEMTAEDLKDFFSEKGAVTDVFIPKPFRAFAFVSFADAELAQSLCGEEFIINSNSVYVSHAVPKDTITSAARSRYAGSSMSPGISPLMAKGRAMHGQANQASPWAAPTPYNSPYGGDGMGYGAYSRGAAGGYGGGVGAKYGGYGGFADDGVYEDGPSSRMKFSNYGQDLGGQAGYGGDQRSMYGGGGSQSRQAAAVGAQLAAVMNSGGQPANAMASGTNQATLGMGALNLNSLISPQALQAAITNALAGLVAGGGQMDKPGGGAAAQGIDLAGMLANATSTTAAASSNPTWSDENKSWRH